jgi:glycosyltransferase involved in cell wall biosynthesis
MTIIKILNSSAKNTGIARYVEGIPNNEIYSLQILNNEYPGKIIKPKFKYFPWSIKVNKPRIAFDIKGLEHFTFIYSSQATPIISNDINNQFVIIHDILPLKYNPKKGVRKYIKNQIERFRDVKRIITPSNYTKERLVKEFSYNTNKIDVIPSYISPNLTITTKSKEELRKELNLPLNKKIIINVAGGTPNKGNNELPIIMKILPNDFILVHIGPNIKGERIINIQNIDDSKLSLYYQASDLYLATSYDEGFGLPPIEAQYLGIPVIARKLKVFEETMKNTYIKFEDWNNVTDVYEGFDNLDQAEGYWRQWYYTIMGGYNLKDEYAEKGKENAKKYTYEVFKNNWLKWGENYYKGDDKNVE